jgi:dihydrodipicolinate synthase/N-acetylneuraminate lyase
MNLSSPGCPAELRAALNSPIPSLRTPFTADGEMDEDGIRAQVDFVIAGGAKFIMLTYGDSLHTILSDDEVARLAKVVVDQTAGRAKVIASDSVWPTPKAVAYAEYCQQIGADLLMLLPPDWGASTTPETLVEHCNAVGRHMPLMLVTAFFEQSGVFGARPESFRMDVIRALYERVPSMVSIKDDVFGELGIQICKLTSDRWAVVSGGWMKNHLAQVPLGVAGYLCGMMSYVPEIPWRYWRAVEARDWQAAGDIVRDIETPYREHVMSYEGGFNCAMHGLFELYGICSRHIRPPYHTISDGQLEQLKHFLQSQGLL